MTDESLTVREMELDVQKRLIVIETQMIAMKNLTSWTKANMLVLLSILVGAAVGYGSLTQEVAGLVLAKSTDKLNNSTALVLLADHGTELAGIRAEHQRMRGKFDSIQKELSLRTVDRFYKSDGDRLERRDVELADRIKNLEEDRLQHYKESK